MKIIIHINKLIKLRKTNKYLKVIFKSTKPNPITLVDDVTNIKPTDVTMATKQPVVLNTFLAFSFERIFLCMIMSLITADNTINSQQVMNGIDESSPFYVF